MNFFHNIFQTPSCHGGSFKYLSTSGIEIDTEYFTTNLHEPYESVVGFKIAFYVLNSFFFSFEQAFLE